MFKQHNKRMKVKSLPFAEICTKLSSNTYIHTYMHVCMYVGILSGWQRGCPLPVMICVAMKNRIYHVAILRAAILSLHSCVHFPFSFFISSSFLSGCWLSFICSNKKLAAASTGLVLRETTSKGSWLQNDFPFTTYEINNTNHKSHTKDFKTSFAL